MFGDTGDSWDVQHSVPLKSVFFLAQAQEDQVELLDVAEFICLLVHSVEHVSFSMLRRLGEDERRAIRLRRFDNICALAPAVPCYRLNLSRTGEFWHEIERVIDIDKSK